MERKTEYFKSSDGRTDIYVSVWEPEEEPWAVLQIAHGMVEFIDRYDRFARVLAGQGILVAGSDHLGHGDSVVSKEDWGFFAEEDGNRKVLADLHTLQHRLRASYPGLPSFLIGHSMGSFLVRQYLHTYPEDSFAGVLILGTGMQPAWLISAGLAMSRLIGFFRGPRYRSPFLDRLTLGGNAKHFPDSRTPLDWLSRDGEIVDLYLADERNRFKFTTRAFTDMFTGIRSLYRKKNLEKMDTRTPVFIASGGDDPVGDMGKAVPLLARKYRELGFGDVTVKSYEGGRHELVNETNREEVDRDILDFIRDKARGQAGPL